MHCFCFFSQDQNARERALQTMASMSSAQIVSATAIHNKMSGNGSMQAGSLPPSVGAVKTPASPSSGVSCHPLLLTNPVVLDLSTCSLFCLIAKWWILLGCIQERDRQK